MELSLDSKLYGMLSSTAYTRIGDLVEEAIREAVERGAQMGRLTTVAIGGAEYQDLREEIVREIMFK